MYLYIITLNLQSNNFGEQRVYSNASKKCPNRPEFTHIISNLNLHHLVVKNIRCANSLLCHIFTTNKPIFSRIFYLGGFGVELHYK